MAFSIMNLLGKAAALIFECLLVTYWMGEIGDMTFTIMAFS
jgi:hypothetical protein